MPETKKTYEFLDRQGVLDLAEQILTSVNNRITERIVQTIDNTSDAVHVPSAAAVYSAISAIKATKIIPYTGNINDITDPELNAIYLQRDDESDVTWTMYVYGSVETTTPPEEDGGEPTVTFVNQWISIGTTDLTLDNYWSKSETDIAALKTALGIDDIATSVADKVGVDQMVAFTTEDITSIVTQAYTNTEILNPSTNEDENQ